MSDWTPSYPVYDGAATQAPVGPAAAPVPASPTDPTWSPAYPKYQGTDTEPAPNLKTREPVGIGEDITRSLGPQTVRGGAYAVGMFGDLQHMLERGVDYGKSAITGDRVSDQSLGDLITGRPKDAPPPANKEEALTEAYLEKLAHGAHALPTSESIMRRVEGVTGPLYHPETTTGQIVTKPLEFIGAVFGPGGLRVAKSMPEVIPSLLDAGKKFLTRAGIPGLTSESAGQVADRVAPEAAPYVRGGVALATGGLGALAEGPKTAEAALTKYLPSYVTKSHIDQAAQLISDAAKMPGGAAKLTWPEALSQVTGKPVLQDMIRILESSPYSREQMQTFFADRPQAFKDAAPNVFDRTLGPASPDPHYLGTQVSEAAQDTIARARATMNQATRASYDAAGQSLVPKQAHQAMMSDPRFAQALDEVRNNSHLNSYVRTHSDRSVAVYDAVAKHLEEMAENSAAGTSTQKSNTISASQKTLGAEVKDVAKAADNVANGGTGTYEKALADQALLRDKYLNPLMAGPLKGIANNPETTAVINALFPQGQNALSGGEGAVTRAVQALSARNPVAAAAIVRQKAAQVFDSSTADLIHGDNQMGAAKFRKNLVGHPQEAKNLEAAVRALPGGDQRWEGFQRFLDIAAATGQRQRLGSLTAFNEREMQSLSTGGTLANLVKHGGSPEEWLSIVHDAMGKWQLGRNVGQLAAILTDPKSGALLKRLIDVNPASSHAGAIAARLITQTRAAANSNGQPDTVK